MENLLHISFIICAVLLAVFLFITVKYIYLNKNPSGKKSILYGMEKLLNLMDTIIVITEIETDKVIFYNDKARKEFGVEGDSVVGEICWEVFAQNGKNIRCAECHKNQFKNDKGGSMLWDFFSPITNKEYRVMSRFIDWPDGSKVFLKQLYDVSELKTLIAAMKESQEKLRIARDAAETASRAKSLFLSNISQEIRTPLNSIIGFSELAADNMAPDKVKDYLGKIQESAELLVSIINDILDISLIESDKAELEHIPFTVGEILSYCHKTIQPKAQEKGISLRCIADPPVTQKLTGDPVKLRQALVNLLSNAVKFTETGSVALSVSLIKSDVSAATVNFEVKDTGIGMSAEEKIKAFEPFTQGGDGVTRKIGGAGLGLTITKNIIEMMGGVLKAESSPGKGSVFSFILEFKTAKETFEQQTEKKLVIKDNEIPVFEGEILVCEDSRMNQQVICEHLSRVGLKTVVAKNGREGVDIVTERILSNQKQFDLIFMDIHMPVMDGLEASSKIKALDEKIPIVALTANVIPDSLEKYKASGMCDILGKPFKAQDLWKCLNKNLNINPLSSADKPLKLWQNEE